MNKPISITHSLTHRLTGSPSSHSALRTPNSALITSFTNQLQLDTEGWAQLAPFGDYPGQALLREPGGSIAKFPAIQRLDRAAAVAMVARFKSPWHRVKRYFTGCNIYVGHPDVPAFANDYPDKSPKGMIVDLEVRADGLYCKPVFTSEGSELVETRQLRAFSAYWSDREIGQQPNPAAGPALKVYRPDQLKSAGLTNHPNLPVHLLNEQSTTRDKISSNAEAASPSPGGEGRGEGGRISKLHSITDDPQPTIMNKKLILDFLLTQGITLANEATDTQVADALQQLGDRVTIAETTLATRSLELETLNTELANERQFHHDTLLDAALAAGSITPAQRPDWAARLATDFANQSAALAQLAPTLKTRAFTLNLGARKAEIANATARRDALDTLVKTEMANNGGDYDRAFAVVQKSNPALFSAMKQPANPS